MSKVCFILPSLSGGGAERAVINVANYLANKSLLVDLVVVNRSGAYVSDIAHMVNLIDLRKSRVLFSLFSLIRYFKENKPDATLTTMPHMNMTVILARFFSGIKTNLVIQQPNYLSLNRQPKWWANNIRLVIFFFNLADKVVGISRGVCYNLKQLGAKHCQTIYNPAVFPKLFELAKETTDFKFNKKTFITVGRLVEQKNFALLINAFAEVKKKIDAQLIILGEGKLRDSLTKQISTLELENDVRLLGFIDNPYAYMQQADVFVLSSLWEGFGNVIVESLALGTQVVATDCPSGPSEILEGGKYGFLVENNNQNELSDAMIKALESPIDSKKLASRANDFQVDKIAKQYYKVLLNK